MPAFPIIDAHVHFYDAKHVPYSWMAEDWPRLDHPHLMPDFERATPPVSVERVIFCEVRADHGYNLKEIEFVHRLATQDARLAAATGWAPLEMGAAVEETLVELMRSPILRGIRRGFDPDNYGMGLEARFLDGIRTCGRMGLHYELAVPHFLLGYALEVAKRVPEVPIVLNHIGMPDIAHQLWEPWAAQITEIGRLEHVSVKVSGGLAVAGVGWTAERISPFIRHALESFGFERAMFGSDWPSLERFGSYADWVELVDGAVSGASREELERLYRGTAIDVFRLDTHLEAAGDNGSLAAFG